ncbi:hypothetical protein SLEP1_g43812 [Rubroshorea leprosula]|uniref:Heparanase-like protein 1 n=1 Tax=Rubroshorea leprosula TaxID=152421 RepID=A0AAV5LFV6_9ROSI|nr:hypothetical protein SLEP1_g43812 [Rubroshorea leprosula]
MASRPALLLFLALLSVISAVEVEHATITIDGSSTIAKTDNDFVCATLDWWPHDKCDYHHCPWGYASVINLNLSHPALAKAVKAFNRLRIRIGGSLQDRVLYDVGSLKTPCHPFQKMKDGMFGFSMGCLHMNRWDELNKFFNATGVMVTFGLNALNGRQQLRRNLWGGDWDYTNAQDFMKYTISKGYHIDSWEFGNELSGSGIGASVGAEQYGKDVINLKKIINNLYSNSLFKPSLIAPGGFFDRPWFAKLLQVSGPHVVDVISHHLYNLGAGVDPNLVRKILDPEFLSRVSTTFSNLTDIISENGPWSSAWVGESGGAYNSGGPHVSNTFVNSFWYLDQLGMASKHHTKVYCRQTLIGGNYGLLNTTTFLPNPDYYSALLWHRLMGRGVLAVDSDASPLLRSYAHCTKGRPGVTLLLLNLSNQTNFILTVQNQLNIEVSRNNRRDRFTDGLKRTFSWVGIKETDKNLFREEYHLTPKDGYLQSQTMVLNGLPIEPTEAEHIPELEPVHLDLTSPISIAPLSISFIVFPNMDAPACVA